MVEAEFSYGQTADQSVDDTRLYKKSRHSTRWCLKRRIFTERRVLQIYPVPQE